MSFETPKLIQIVADIEVWSEYKLSDGSTIKVKPNIVSVFFTGHDPSGMPIYGINGGIVLRIEKVDEKNLVPTRIPNPRGLP